MKNKLNIKNHFNVKGNYIQAVMSGSFEKIKTFIEHDGIVFGGSAGTIILGKCIDTCKYADRVIQRRKNNSTT